MMKIDNLFALYTLEVLMGAKIGIEPLGITRTFNNKCKANSVKCQQGPVNGIQRYVWNQLFYPLKNRFSAGMFRGFCKHFINRNSLGGYFKAGLTTFMLERFYV
jgi:hypothetical protein